MENRKEDGSYRSIFDLAKRVDLRAANKKAFENLALAGGFDSFGDTHRAQYFHDEGDGITFLEKAVKYGSKFQENQNSSQVSLFGEASEVQIPEPIVPPCEEWGTMEKLRREKSKKERLEKEKQRKAKEMERRAAQLKEIQGTREILVIVLDFF